MNIEQLYKDYNIPFAIEDHKHCRPGWVNTVCPFCTGNPGLHLGYSIDNNRFVCWRCGGKSTIYAISALLSLEKANAYKIVQQYNLIIGKTQETKRKIRIKAFKYPNNLIELQKNHQKYLIKRNFDPNKLIMEWQIMGTGVNAMLDNIDYKHRLIIPFVWNSKVVSFGSRDITNRSKNKYMSCPSDRELIPHKAILYGKQNKWGDTGICVEGPTDVWKMGINSFSVSGINYTFQQLRIMSTLFKRIFVIFDNDPQAIKQANKLVADLKFRNIDAIRIDIKEDPGSLSQDNANHLIKQLMK